MKSELIKPYTWYKLSTVRHHYSRQMILTLGYPYTLDRTKRVDCLLINPLSVRDCLVSRVMPLDKIEPLPDRFLDYALKQFPEKENEIITAVQSLSTLVL